MVTIRTFGRKWAHRRWLRRLIGLNIVLVLGAASSVIYLHADARPVSVDTALDRFRSSRETEAGGAPSSPTTAPLPDPTGAPAGVGADDASPGSTSPPPAAGSTSPAAPSAGPGVAGTFGPPPEGVYVYDTVGFEETDALGGARHEYPPQTTVTVRHLDCGWTQRWQPLEERWDELRLCRADRGRMLLELKTFHEFFRQTQQQDNVCGQDSVYLPTPPDSGSSTQVACSGSFGTVAMSTHVLGRERVAVAGADLDAIRVRYDVQFSGSNRGAGSFEEWTDERGVLLRRTWSMDIETDSPFGTVRYRESYEIVLTAAEPQT